MGHSSTTLLVGSCEPFSGKSALVMGLVEQLRERRLPLRYGKPLATSIEQQSPDGPLIDDDVRFVGEIFNLPVEALLPSLQSSTPDPTQAQLRTGAVVSQVESLDSLLLQGIKALHLRHNSTSAELGLGRIWGT